jgi:hypothetical protein
MSQDLYENENKNGEEQMPCNRIMTQEEEEQEKVDENGGELKRIVAFSTQINRKWTFGSCVRPKETVNKRPNLCIAQKRAMEKDANWKRVAKRRLVTGAQMTLNERWRMSWRLFEVTR